MEDRGEKKTTKDAIALILLSIFTFTSFVFINPYTETIRPQMRSSLLQAMKRKEGDKEITDYVDGNGIITYASDLGYASLVITRLENSFLEEYYDEQGERVAKSEGYYGVLKEFDSNGNNNRIIYLGFDGNPVMTSQNYAIEEKTFTDAGIIKTVKYLDIDGAPTCSKYYGYGRENEFDGFGNVIKITYLDIYGEPMIAGIGYAVIIRTFYPEDGPNKGRSKDEFYFDDSGNPIQHSQGNYGLRRDYDEKGDNTVLIYLDAIGSPTVTVQGYTTVIRSYCSDYTTEMYYDIEGNPFCLPEGQYGIKRQGGKTIYLNADGSEKFDLKNFLNNHSEVVILCAFIIMLCSTLCGEKINFLFAFLYIGVVVFFTLLYRGTTFHNVKYGILESYIKMFIDSEIRASIIKNIWLFVPLGAILYQLYPKRIVFLMSVAISVIVELIQYATGIGYCELDDIISNSFGGWIGFESAMLLKNIKNSLRNK